MHKATEGKSTSKPWGIGPTSSKCFKDIIYLVVCACVSVCVRMCVCACAHAETRRKHPVPSSITLCLSFGGRVSSWAQGSCILSEAGSQQPQQSSCLCHLGNWGCWQVQNTQLDPWILRSKLQYSSPHNCSSTFKPWAVSVPSHHTLSWVPSVSKQLCPPKTWAVDIFREF